MFEGRTSDGTAYEVLGPEGAPTLALIHGLGLSRRLWDQHLPALSASHQVINYDLYGHGESAPPPTRSPVSLASYAEQLRLLLDELDVGSVAVIGFSIGGMINRRFALDHPDRMWAQVILNSPHDRGEDAQLLVEERAAQVRSQGPMATMDAALKRWFTPEYLNSGATGPSLVRDWRGLADQESYAQATWVLANGVRELTSPDPPVVMPTLVMTTENDPGQPPAMARAIAAEIAGAETIIVPRLQHLGLMEQPDVFISPILEFLERCSTFAR